MGTPEEIPTLTVPGIDGPAWRIAVVGGGIAGLSAAYRLSEVSGVDVTVFERSHQLGGKLHAETLAGRPIEAGAEAFLVRTDGAPSAALLLAQELGLPVVHPTGRPAGLVLDGAIQPLPTGTVMGVPARPEAVESVAKLVDQDIDEGHPVLGPGADVSIGALLRQRLGDQVVDLLVDPLLGGVYAGNADELSLAMTVPALADALRQQPTVLAAAAAVLEARRHGPPAPMFAAIDGGMSRLVATLADRIGANGGHIRPDATVRELHRGRAGWRVTTGSTQDAHQREFDAVVLALPARPAARLLAHVVPGEALAPWADLGYASVALVTLALPGVELPELSGFLVPASSGYTIKAATFFSQKWVGYAGDLAVVRLSIGRHGDVAQLQRSDEELITLAHKELGTILGQALPEPADAKVNRWGGGLPQYRPGHLDRLATLRAALPRTIAVAGAGTDGIGIPACIRSGQTAAGRILGHLAESGV